MHRLALAGAHVEASQNDAAADRSSVPKRRYPVIPRSDSVVVLPAGLCSGSSIGIPDENIVIEMLGAPVWQAVGHRWIVHYSPSPIEVR